MKHLFLVIGLFVLIGCTKSQPIEQQASSSPSWKIELAKYDNVELIRPKISREKNELVIDGTVKRKPGSLGEIADKVAIVFASSDGQYLDQILLKLNPTTVSDQGSSYSVRYGWIPPEDATIFVNMAGDKNLHLSGGPASSPEVVNQTNFTQTPRQPTQAPMPSRPSMPTAGTRGRGPGR